ncbi:MAG: hypothetical protein ACUVXI_17315 [bacterium]
MKALPKSILCCRCHTPRHPEPDIDLYSSFHNVYHLRDIFERSGLWICPECFRRTVHEESRCPICLGEIGENTTYGGESEATTWSCPKCQLKLASAYISSHMIAESPPEVSSCQLYFDEAWESGSYFKGRIDLSPSVYKIILDGGIREGPGSKASLKDEFGAWFDIGSIEEGEREEVEETLPEGLRFGLRWTEASLWDERRSWEGVFEASLASLTFREGGEGPVNRYRLTRRSRTSLMRTLSQNALPKGRDWLSSIPSEIDPGLLAETNPPEITLLKLKRSGGEYSIDDPFTLALIFHESSVIWREGKKRVSPTPDFIHPVEFAFSSGQTIGGRFDGAWRRYYLLEPSKGRFEPVIFALAEEGSDRLKSELSNTGFPIEAGV